MEETGVFILEGDQHLHRHTALGLSASGNREWRACTFGLTATHNPKNLGYRCPVRNGDHVKDRGQNGGLPRSRSRS